MDFRRLRSLRRDPSTLHVRPPRAGFTLLELVIALGILLVAAGIFQRMLAGTARLRQVQRDNTIAADAARVIVEQMRNADFAEVFALYNDDPDDDPDGAGTAPGHRFEVTRLDRRAAAPDLPVGEVVFPTRRVDVEVPLGGLGGLFQTEEQLHLREDVLDPGLGMPRDLNGDNVVDAADHSGDYVILPVRIVVRWQGHYSERELSILTMLTDFEVGR